MKKLLICAVAALSLAACTTQENKQEEQAVAEPVATQEVAAPAPAPEEVTCYQTADGKASFEVFERNLEAETLKVKDMQSGTVYDMKRTISADGAKYQAADSTFIWFTTRDGVENFSFGKGEEIQYQGTAVVAKPEAPTPTPQPAPANE